MKPKCKVCAGKVLYGNLYCSPQHDAVAEDVAQTTAKGLLAAGFVQSGTSNIYRKDGVGVTLERTIHVGLAEAIRQHGHITAQAKPATAKVAG